MAATTLVLRSVSRPRRCAYCHDGLVSGVACAGCGVRLHPGCWRALRRCPSLGCSGAPRPRARRSGARWGSALPLILLTGLALAPLPAFLVGRALGQGSATAPRLLPQDPDLALRPTAELLQLREAGLALLGQERRGALSPGELRQLPFALGRYAPRAVFVGEDRVEVRLRSGRVIVGPDSSESLPEAPADLELYWGPERLAPSLWWQARR